MIGRKVKEEFAVWSWSLDVLTDENDAVQRFEIVLHAGDRQLNIPMSRSQAGPILNFFEEICED